MTYSGIKVICVLLLVDNLSIGRQNAEMLEQFCWQWRSDTVRVVWEQWWVYISFI